MWKMKLEVKVNGGEESLYTERKTLIPANDNVM